jgi:5'-methylthioadenosine phosphorylase
VIAPCAAGSLQAHVKPGDLVICDQFVDRTSGRKDTFYDGPVTTHISTAEPYCPEMRRIAVEKAAALGLPVHETGTVVVIQGPRFSTKSESRWFSKMGWEVINMTQYPECVLARELNLCYVNISVITDYDVGLEGRADIEPVTHEEVVKTFQANIGRLKDLLFEIISATPRDRGCKCGESLKLGRFE